MPKDIWTIGCDPEYFLRKKESHEYVSSIPHVKGTKDEPEPLPQGGFVMKDNVAIEFGVPPASNVEDFVKYVCGAVSDLNEYLPNDLELCCVPSAYFPKEELTHPEAQEFGCAPDYNAWLEDVNEPPCDAADGTFRACGGHVHTGSPLIKAYADKIRFIKVMDCMHGHVSTKLDNSKEAIERRYLYGKAGCFRFTDYGAEYRTMSNFWVKTEKLMRLVYHMTGDALDILENKLDDKLIKELGGERQIRMTIDEGKEDVAGALVDTVINKYMSDTTLNLYKECV
jgi:hypothetical protein